MFPTLNAHTLKPSKVHDHNNNYSKFTIFEHVWEFFRDPRHYTHRNTFWYTTGGSRLLIVLYYRTACLWMYFMLGYDSRKCKSWSNHLTTRMGKTGVCYEHSTILLSYISHINIIFKTKLQMFSSINIKKSDGGEPHYI